IIIDRCYIHGHENADVARGIALNSARTAVIDSHISECHGRGFDTQAIAGWNGPGPYKIVNNRLEAAGENVMFGGADPKIPGLVPSDIEVRRNHFYKPLTWNPLDASYAGMHWTVKNIFELKNASRVLIDGNLFENNWADGQNGMAILFTPRNQDGTAEWSVVSDVTFTNNIVLNSAGGVLISGYDYIWPSQQTRRVLIKNNLFDGIGAPGLGFNGRLFHVSDRVADLQIDHNTAMHTGNVVTASGRASTGFVYTNNLSKHNSYGVIGDGKGSGNSTLNYYFPGFVFAKNVLTGGPGWIYPAGNYFPASLYDVAFVDMDGRNYRLSDSSPYRNAGTDGKDLGADIDAILEAMASTQEPTPPPAPNRPPAVSIAASATSGFAPLTVQFSSSASDPDGQIVSYAWDFGDGQTSSEPSPVHVFTASGSYTARLVVTDDAGATASAEVLILVAENTPPPAVRVLKPNKREVMKAGAIYTIKWSVSGAVQSQDIEVSLDNGRTWSYIRQGLPAATTAFAWRVPATATTSGFFRVTAFGVNGASVSDMNDIGFVINLRMR
ncbi:MAG TPA: PKD domain-containing protein, partial [Blastocatellia bacterium]|nr:PKD domain-containing protein [Blastocatellia bacterium]